jgi:glutamine synthetase
MLAAGLQGIKEGLMPPDPVEKNIYSLSEKEQNIYRIEQLPESLGHAIQISSKSEFLKNVLGDHIFYNLLHVKSKEWEEYRMQVTKWEIDKYLQVV